MTTPQDTNKTAEPTAQKEVSAKQEVGGTNSTKKAATTQKTSVQKSGSAQSKSTSKAASTPARRSTAVKSVKQPSKESVSKDTSVESKHIADQVKAFSSRRVWPD